MTLRTLYYAYAHAYGVTLFTSSLYVHVHVRARMRVVTGDRSSAKESRSRAFNRTKLMEETGQEEVRPGSANSDNGLDGGFVEVTEEDAQMAQWDPSPPPPVIPPAMDDDADLYGDDREGEDQGAGEDGEEGGAVDDLENEKVRTTPR